MEVIKLHLTPAQQNKIACGKSLQLSAQQLAGTSGDPVDIHMLRKHCNELRRAQKHGKGYRFA
jgi:hypothetical protein